MRCGRTNFWDQGHAVSPERVTDRAGLGFYRRNAPIDIDDESTFGSAEAHPAANMFCSGTLSACCRGPVCEEQGNDNQFTGFMASGVFRNRNR
jgi:hypothetical protein